MLGGVRTLVASMGLGSKVAFAATLLVTAFYIYRAIGVARLVSDVVGTLTHEILVVLVIAAVFIGLGWASPNVGVAVDHIQLAVEFGVEKAKGPVRRLVRLVVDVAIG